jgi:hypothetical protein
MLNKSLNHKSIIAAFEDVYKEFSQMSDTDFQSMIHDSELESLGSLLYETNTVTGYGDTRGNYVRISIVAFHGDSVVHKDYSALIGGTEPDFKPASSDNYMSNNEDEIWLKAA